MRTSSVVLIASILVGIGCGQSAEDDVADVIRSYSSALGQRQYGKACGYLTPAGKTDLKQTAKQLELEAPDCETAFRGLLRNTPDWQREYLRGDTVEDVRIRGQRAYGHVKEIPLSRLRKVGGEWKIENPFYD
jgi:hypothetical protein